MYLNVKYHPLIFNHFSLHCLDPLNLQVDLMSVCAHMSVCVKCELAIDYVVITIPVGWHQQAAVINNPIIRVGVDVGEEHTHRFRTEFYRNKAYPYG